MNRVALTCWLLFCWGNCCVVSAGWLVLILSLLVVSFLFPCLPCLALPCLALPCLALPCLALPCLLVLPCGLVLSCRVLHFFINFYWYFRKCHVWTLFFWPGLLQPPAAHGRGQQLARRRSHLGCCVGAGAAHHGQLEGALCPRRGDEVQLLLPHAFRRRLPLLPTTGGVWYCQGESRKGGGCTHFMRSRSLGNINPRIPKMPGRSAGGGVGQTLYFFL